MNRFYRSKCAIQPLINNCLLLDRQKMDIYYTEQGQLLGAYGAAVSLGTLYM